MSVPNPVGDTVAPIEHKLGQRCSDTAQIVLEDMVLPPDLMLGEESLGAVRRT